MHSLHLLSLEIIVIEKARWVESFLQNVSVPEPFSECFQRVPRKGMVCYIEVGSRDVSRTEATEKILALSERKFL